MFPSFKSIFHLLDTCNTQDECINLLEKALWQGGIVSPFDKGSKVYRCKNGKYRCKSTGKYFTVTTGTMFEATKLPLKKWFYAIWKITVSSTGITSVFLAKDMGITQKTAWHMLQRIRACFGIENKHILSGTVECDETFYGGKNKNRHKKNKFDYSKGGTEKIPVIGMIERGGNIVCRVISNRSKSEMQSAVISYVEKGSRLITDEHTSYEGLDNFYEHEKINHSAYEYVSLDDISKHNNNIESAWRSFKRSASGTYSHVSKKHLQKYVDEFVYRYNMRKHTESDKFLWILANSNTVTKYNSLKKAETPVIKAKLTYKSNSPSKGRKKDKPFPWDLN